MYLQKSHSQPRKVIHLALGRVDYHSVYELQRRLHHQRVAGEIEDLVISVEHNPVFTIGRLGSRSSILATEDELACAGIPIYHIDRGGDATYHGPGQLVIYPIFDLRNYGRDIKEYIRNLEEVVVRYLTKIGIDAEQRNGLPGIWVGKRKIGSIGVSIRNWVTMHGLALNVAVDKNHWRMIHPCGMDIEMVSIADLISQAPILADVQQGILNELAVIFSLQLICEKTARPLFNNKG